GTVKANTTGNMVDNTSRCRASEFEGGHVQGMCEAEDSFEVGGLVPPGDNPSALLTKSHAEVGAGGTIDPGDTVEYTLQLTNDGGKDLTNVEVWDYFDTANLDNVAITQGTRCDGVQPAGQLCFDVGNLPVPSGDGLQQKVAVKYQGTVKANTTGNMVDNTSRCRASEFEGGHEQGMCEAEDSFEVGGLVPPQSQPHASLSKSVGNTSVQAERGKYVIGDTVEYTLTVSNDGNTDLTNMTVIDDYDEGYLENVTITQGTDCGGLQQPGEMCFDVGTLSEPTGGTTQYPSSITLKYTAQIKNNGVGATVNNTADCTSDQYPIPGGISEICRDQESFPVEGISPAKPYELWVTEEVDRATADPGQKLNYTTSGGNRGEGPATGVWFLTSLLMPAQTQLLQEAVGELSQTPTISELETVLQQKLGILSPVQQLQGSGPGSIVELGPYTNLPGDDYVTGLDIISVTGPIKLDLDHDGIYDTIIHQENATWAAGYRDVQVPFTTVRNSLAPGDYTIRSTGAVLKPDSQEVLTDVATTTVKVPGVVEPSPVLGATKLVTDNDETNVPSNTAEAGEVLTYTISYTNSQQGSTAREAWIDDDYDEAYVTIIDTGGAEDSGNGLFWYLGDVPYGQSVTKTFTARVVSPTPPDGITFNNVATVGAKDVVDVDATVVTTVPAIPGPLEEQPYLTSSKTMADINGGAVEPGDILRYSVTIKNDGNGAATDVEIIDDLPNTLEDLTVVTIPNGATDQSSGNQLYITGFSVAAGDSGQIVYTAQVVAGLADGTSIPNGIVAIEDNPTPGTLPTTPGPTTPGPTTPGPTTPTTPGETTTTTSSRPGTVSGQVGSAYTGPGTGSQAAAQVAGAQTIAQAAETGGNVLMIAIITTLLAVGAGVGVIYLRKQLAVTS
ncbi:hypothetical protein ACFL0Z_03115, partial [Patescibacteria group bacterium]